MNRRKGADEDRRKVDRLEWLDGTNDEPFPDCLFCTIFIMLMFWRYLPFGGRDL